MFARNEIRNLTLGATLAASWEEAYRLTAMVGWPGHIKVGSVNNGIVSHLVEILQQGAGK